MVSMKKVSRFAVIASVLLLAGLTGCTKKPSEEELTKLEEARSAAESAERKLAELRSERMALEAQLTEKKSELSNQESERDNLKSGN